MEPKICFFFCVGSFLGEDLNVRSVEKKRNDICKYMFSLPREGGDHRSSSSSLCKDKSALGAALFSFWCFLGHLFFSTGHPIGMKSIFHC